MKAKFIFILVVLGLTGAFAGLLYAHVIPADQLAKSSPVAATALKAVGLLDPSAHTADSLTNDAQAVGVPYSAPQRHRSYDDTDTPVNRAVTAARHVFEHHRRVHLASAETDEPKPATEAAPDDTPRAAPAVDAGPETPISPKLADIYDTMGADELSRIFAKQTDRQVAGALSVMDERQSGKVLAAMPPERAARIASMLGSDGAAANSTQ